MRLFDSVRGDGWASNLAQPSLTPLPHELTPLERGLIPHENIDLSQAGNVLPVVCSSQLTIAYRISCSSQLQGRA